MEWKKEVPEQKSVQIQANFDPGSGCLLHTEGDRLGELEIVGVEENEMKADRNFWRPSQLLKILRAMKSQQLKS